MAGDISLLLVITINRVGFDQLFLNLIMSAKVEQLQKNLQQELDSFRICQKGKLLKYSYMQIYFNFAVIYDTSGFCFNLIEYQKAVTKRQQLDAQLNENTSVKNELDLLKDDGEVFKLIGPVLIKQDLDEAKQNVAKRMEYIVSEL